MSKPIRAASFTILILMISAACFAQAPSASFTPSVTSGCSPTLVQFVVDDLTGITTYAWTFGNGGTSSLASPLATYYTPSPYATTNYTVTLTATGPGGTDTKTQTITIYGKPAISLSGTPTSGCAPLSVNFNSVVTMNSPNGPNTPMYTWDFGDGSSGTGSSTSHAYAAGDYPVTLFVRNGAGCDTSLVISNYIHSYARPIGNFTADKQEWCSAPATVQFLNTTTGGTPPYSANWTFGDATPGVTNNNAPPHTYTAAGKYTVTMTATDAHGCATISPVIVKPDFITVITTSVTLTATPTAQCQGADIVFHNTTAGASFSSWDFGDGFTATGDPVPHSFNVAGTYWVKISTTVGSTCQKKDSILVTINPNPLTTIDPIPLPCPPPVIVNFHATTTNAPASAMSYVWDFSDGGSPATFNGNPGTTTYSIAKYRTVGVTATNTITGCKTTVVLDDVNQIPILNMYKIIVASPEAGCIPFKTTLALKLFTTTVPNFPPTPSPFPPGIPRPDTPVSWNWSFPGSTLVAGTVTSATPTIVDSNVGTYIINVHAFSQNGCLLDTSRTIHADVPVPPSFTVSPVTACANVDLTFTNTTSPQVPNTTYIWSLGDSSFEVNTFKATFNHHYHTPGTYDVILSTDHRGCIDTSIKRNLITIHPPNALFGYVVNCPPSNKVDFTDMSIGATGWTWDFGDGTTDNRQNPNHTYAATGTYDVKLTTTNSIYGCSDNITKKVTVYKPALTLTADDVTACAGQTVHFEGTFGVGIVASYAWIIGNNPVTPYLPNNAFDYQFTDADTGSNTITMVTISGNNNNCFDTLKKPGYVLVSRPYAYFTPSQFIGCAPLTVTFTDHSTYTHGDPRYTTGAPIVSREWTYGDGSPPPGNVTSATHTYLEGVDNVKLHVTDAQGCTGDTTFAIESRHPHADFDVADQAVCTHTDVLFHDRSHGATGLSYLWSFGDGTTDTAKNPLHRYNMPGTYSVQLTVTDASGCTDTKLVTSYITAQGPVAGYRMNDSISIGCSPLTVQFTNTSSADVVSYAWNFTGGTAVNSTIPNPTSTYSVPGNYKPWLAVSDGRCTDTVRHNVYVLGYANAFTYTPVNGCQPMTVRFTTPLGAVPKITWDFNDGTVDTTNSASVTHTYTGAGPYMPSVIFGDGKGCFKPSAGTIPIKPDKVTANFAWSVPCAGSPFTLTDKTTTIYSAPADWLWRFGGGATAGGATPSYTFATPGNHAVQLVVTNGFGCKDSITKDIFINPPPPVDAGKDTGVCPGDPVYFTASGAQSYSWTPAALVTTPNSASTFARLDGDTTKYFVTGTDANGCVNTDSVLGYIQLRTSYTLYPGGAICVGDTFQLHAAGAQTYSWTPSESLSNPHIADPVARPEITTTYIIEAQEGSCDISRDSVTVVVHPLPQFSAGNDELINLGSAVILQPTQSGIDHIEWRADTSLSCRDCFRPAASPLYTTTYYARAYSEYGCVDSDSVTVHVRCNGSLVFIPNTFTPNGDGNNDFFFPRGKGIDQMSVVRIFNRWGELVFEKQHMAVNDERSGWDGTFKGKELPPDTYIYTMETRCVSGEPVTWRGDITLIR